MPFATGSWCHTPELPETGQLCLVQLQNRQFGTSYHAMRYVRNTWRFEGGALLSSEQRVVKWAVIADTAEALEVASAPPVERPTLTHQLPSAVLGDKADRVNDDDYIKSLWVFVDGTSADRNIRAAYHTREDAEAARHLVSPDCTLEEISLGPPLPAPPAGHSLWYVEKLLDYEVFGFGAYVYKESTNIVRRNANSSNVLVWARDEAHARALAKELIDGERARLQPSSPT